MSGTIRAALPTPSVDLNLLTVLAELLETPNTVLVARRLGVTQSAVSHALARLRVSLDDPLFVKVGRALEPTRRALDLKGPLGGWRATTEALLSRAAPVEPAKLKRRFRLSTTDAGEALLLARLTAVLARDAPHVAIEVTNRGDAVEKALQQGEIDLALGFSMREADGVLSQTLFEDRLVVVSTKGARRTPSLAAYLGARHVVVSPRSLPGGLVDDALEKLGHRRFVAVRTPSFASAMGLVSSGLTLTLPERFARGLGADPRGLAPLPFDTPKLTYRALFPLRDRDDPAHRFLRERIYRVHRMK